MREIHRPLEYSEDCHEGTGCYGSTDNTGNVRSHSMHEQEVGRIGFCTNLLGYTGCHRNCRHTCGTDQRIDLAAGHYAHQFTEQNTCSGTEHEGDHMRIALQTRDGGQTVIRRQVMRHAPCVVMLVHDCAQDLYLVEREYRVGCDAFAYGLPAGLIDDGEDVDAAALRELREETGVEPIDENSCDIDHVGQFYSSEGMTDELANIMVVHLRHWQAVERHFDADEHVESAWIPWKQLRDTHITASNSEIAILHEQIRRMRQQ